MTSLVNKGVTIRDVTYERPLTGNWSKVIARHDGAGLGAAGGGVTLAPVSFVAALLSGWHLHSAMRELVTQFTSLQKNTFEKCSNPVHLISRAFPFPGDGVQQVLWFNNNKTGFKIAIGAG